MRVLVTGGAGFIGSHIVEYYAKRGCDVLCYDNLSRAQLLKKPIDVSYNWNYLKRFRTVKFVKGDVRNLDGVKNIAKDIDIIVHTAAQTAVTTSLTDPKTDFEVNALGTFNVLEAARLSNTEPAIVYCSTNKAYGDNVNKIRVSEKETRYVFEDRYKEGVPENFPIDLCQHTPYGCSKLLGDLYVQDYAHTYGLKTGVFRMSCIYGDRQLGIEDQGWLAWFAIATITGKPITIYGDGKQVRDVLYVTDLLQAYDTFINSNLRHEVFNIGGGPENTLSLLESLELLKKLTGNTATVSFNDWRESDQKVYVSDISKCKKKLHWKPKIGLKEGVRKLVQWVKTQRRLFS